MAHAGLALGSSLVPLSIGLLHFLYLSRFIPNLKQIFWHMTYLKTFVLTALLGLIVFSLIPLTTNLLPNKDAALAIQLAIIIGISASVYFFGAHIWRIPEMQDVTTIIRNKIAKWRK